MSRKRRIERYYEDDPRGMGCLTALSLTLLTAAVVCSVLILIEVWQYDVGVYVYDQLESQAVSEAPSRDDLSGGTEGGLPPPPGSTDASEADPPELSVNFEVLTQTNSDVIGWLYAPGTDINYPVVQGTDNSFYLTHLFTKAYGKLGTLFADCTTDAFHSDNTVVYGHNMENGAMLHCLMEYKKQSYYDAHPTMRMYTPEGNYTFTLTAAFNLDLREADNERFYLKDLNDEEQDWFLRECAARSCFSPATVVPAGASLMTLSTCDNAYEGLRFLVVGWLIPDES